MIALDMALPLLVLIQSSSQVLVETMGLFAFYSAVSLLALRQLFVKEMGLAVPLEGFANCGVPYTAVSLL